jgi:SAM-dependent methyltransferase
MTDRVQTNSDIANIEQANWWDADEGEYWTQHEERYHRSTARHYRHLVEAAAIHPGERVLDIGCGCGQSTRDAARAAAPGAVLGVDLSRAMLERARQRTREEQLANVTFEHADAQIYRFAPASFDAVISRFGSMFFVDRDAAFRNIARAMKPGGRLALLTWQRPQDNEWLQAIRAAFAVGRDLPAEPIGVPGPFGLAEEDDVRGMLAPAGFEDVRMAPVREPMDFGGSAGEAFEFLRGMGMYRGLSKDVGDADKQRMLDNLRVVLEERETPEGVLMDSAAWVITARRA